MTCVCYGLLPRDRARLRRANPLPLLNSNHYENVETKHLKKHTNALLVGSINT
jgi:hypothetical protein